MRVINPAAANTGRTRTMTTRLVALRPSLTDILDAGFLVALVLVGTLGFATSFDSSRYLVVGLVGVLLGVLLAHVCNVLRWHWAVPLAAAVGCYLLLGGFLAFPEHLLAGFLPSLTTVVDLGALAVGGWKELITTLPPLPGDSPQVLLVYLLCLVSGAAGFSVARRSRSAWTAVIVPTLLVVASILLGTYEPAALLPQGLGFAGLSFGWMATRAQRRRRLAGTGQASLTRVGLGAAVLAVAMAGALVLGPVLTGGSSPNRTVLRSFVEPPVELPSYTSPLVGFPKYSRTVEPKRLYDTELLRVESTAPVGRLRLAVLDDYSGIAWNAVAGGSGTASTAFQRVGNTLPKPAAGTVVEARVTVAEAYASIPELGPWVPGTGQAEAILFSGANARNHQRSLRYNLTTGQALVTDRLRPGDVVGFRTMAAEELGDGEVSPGGSPLLGEADYGFLADYLGKLVAKADTTPGDQLRQAMAAMRQGYWSDGTAPSESRYRSGHDQRRLLVFLGGEQMVGSDEQYAATLGLVAAQLGFPSRVVFGANVPADGLVRGKDVTAWVEVQLADGGWRTIRPDQFIPPRDRTPDKIPPQQFKDAAATVVPPPNPVRPPGAFETWFELDQGLLTGNPGWDQFLRILVAVLRWVGPPLAALALVVGGILGAKALRRRRRRTRGAPSARIAGGWREVVDHARDHGHLVPLAATRQEQTVALGRAELLDLSGQADRAIFGPGDPDAAAAADYWLRADASRKAMSASVGRWRRWAARLSLRTFLPPRLAERGLGTTLSGLPWRGHRTGVAD